jgi:hypothetical protein
MSSTLLLYLKKSIGEIPKINSQLDDLEQHSRKSCVRISGVSESVGENTADIVCDIAKKLNVNLVSNDIRLSSSSHVIIFLLSALSVMKIFPSRTEVDFICFCFTACLAR